MSHARARPTVGRARRWPVAIGVPLAAFTLRRMDRASRFNEAKYGLFVHWGAYAVAGVEASWPVMLRPEIQRRFSEAARRLGLAEMDFSVHDISYADYRALPERFDPVEFDALAWARLARAAGQRYLIFTVKHHDGFCMFDSRHTDYKVTNTPFGRDVVAELAAACAVEGIGLGLYYSCPDLDHPGYRDQSQPPAESFLGQPERPEWATYLDYMEAQVTELLTNYGEIFAIWWDVGHHPAFDAPRFHRLVRGMQPDCLMNDRIGGLLPGPGLDGDLLADFQTPEQAIPRSIPRRSAATPHPDLAMLFAVLEQDSWSELLDLAIASIPDATGPGVIDPSLPDAADFLPWEACMTFGGKWAYAPDLPRVKSGAELVRDLVEIASRGGNLLMNVGPTPLGTIPAEMEQSLREAGAWLKRCGRAIYGTTYGPVQGIDGLRTTADGRLVYVHVLDWPADGVVHLPLAAPVSDAVVLATDQPLAFVPGDGMVTFVVPDADRDPVVTTIALRTR